MRIWSVGDLPFSPANPPAGGVWTATRNDDLRRLNQRAIEALNKIDIAGCIRNAMPGATVSSTDEDIETLRIKDEACLYLAVALIQGLGRLDEAVLWWRERRRVRAAIARHYLARHNLAHELRSPIFDQFWSGHIGHTAMLAIHVKKHLLEGKSHLLKLLRPPEPNPSNRCLVDHWQKYFTLYQSPADLPFPTDCLRYVSKDIYLDELLDGSETYFWRVYAEISRAWEKAGRGPLLELSHEEIQRGEQTLATMSIPQGAWYVCLHVRSSGYKAVHEGLHDTLSADIMTYDLAVDAIVERGGWVIRMGDPSMPKLPARKGVFDYPHSPQKADWMDIFLCGTCRFYVGTSSGLAYVPNLFGIPCVFTNWFPTGTRPFNATDIFIPKMHWYDEDNDFVPFAESLAPPLGYIHATSTLRALGVSLKDSTRENLRDVVVEMLDRLDAKANYTAEDELLQARFDAVAINSRSFGNARIGREFVRKYRRLLPTGATHADEAVQAARAFGLTDSAPTAGVV